MSQHDLRHPFDVERCADGFVEVERVTHFVDPDSELGRAMARARESWAEHGVPDPDDFRVEPIPVDPGE